MISKQNKIEQLVFDAVNDIADELEIPVRKYPETYWIHNKLLFEALGLPERYRSYFEVSRKSKTSFCIEELDMIWIAREDPLHIYEEAGHFLHFYESGLRFDGKKILHEKIMHIISEMLGYFGSKIGAPDRINPFEKFTDFIENEEKCLQEVKEMKYNVENFFIYQQGYALGEKLFNAYITEIVSKKQIHSLMKKELKTQEETAIVFAGLKYDFFDFIKKL